MCRAAVSQVASDINNLFQSSSRGELQNKNDNGVTYTSILLNNAVTADNDGALISNSRNRLNGVNIGPYQLVGYDALPNRIRPNPSADVERELFGFNYFRLGTQSIDPFPSPNDQRRIMIINGNTREILFSFTPTGSAAGVRSAVSAMRQTMIDAVNSVTNAPSQTPFEAWASSNNIPENQRGNTDDPDGDGVSNIFEYFSGSNPVTSSSAVLPTVNVVGNDRRFQYTRDTNAAFADPVIMVSENLSSWTPFVPTASDVEETNLGDGLMQFSVRLPTNASGRGFAVLEITESP